MGKGALKTTIEGSTPVCSDGSFSFSLSIGMVDPAGITFVLHPHDIAGNQGMYPGSYNLQMEDIWREAEYLWLGKFNGTHKMVDCRCPDCSYPCGTAPDGTEDCVVCDDYSITISAADSPFFMLEFEDGFGLISGTSNPNISFSGSIDLGINYDACHRDETTVTPYTFMTLRQNAATCFPEPNSCYPWHLEPAEDEFKLCPRLKSCVAQTGSSAMHYGGFFTFADEDIIDATIMSVPGELDVELTEYEYNDFIGHSYTFPNLTASPILGLYEFGWYGFFTMGPRFTIPDVITDEETRRRELSLTQKDYKLGTCDPPEKNDEEYRYSNLSLQAAAIRIELPLKFLQYYEDEPERYAQEFTVIIDFPVDKYIIDLEIVSRQDGGEACFLEGNDCSILENVTDQSKYNIYATQVSSNLNDVKIIAKIRSSSEQGRQEGQLSAKVIDMTMVETDLEIFLPPVIDPSETMIEDEKEETEGSVTFENLDNDDNDNKYDYIRKTGQNDDQVTGGDDELVKLRLKIKPINLQELKDTFVMLNTLNGGNSIQFWRANDKDIDSNFEPDNDLLDPSNTNDFEEEGDFLIAELWIEGIDYHVIQRQSIIQMLYIPDIITSCEDTVSLTIVGVNKISWKGKGNGYTPDGLCNSNTLDDDPNSSDTAVRVFPGDRYISGFLVTDLDSVEAEIELTVPSPYEITYYLKSFDVDDPSNNQFVDPNDHFPGNGNYYFGGNTYTEEEDNRTFREKAGYMKGQDGFGIKEVGFNANVLKERIEFSVSLHPGDNYALACSHDRDFLDHLRNEDMADESMIKNIDESDNGTWEELQEVLRYRTEKDLVVWRILHIEIDSMVQVPAAGPEKNFLAGSTITQIDHANNVAQKVYVNEILRDDSQDLDDTTNPQNGRFETGRILIGSGIGTPGQTETTDLDGNGIYYVKRETGISIPFRITKGSHPDITGNVIHLSGKTFVLNTEHDLTTDYIGGVINVTGTEMIIESVYTSIKTVTVVALAPIPWEVWDDDSNSLLPHFPDTSDMELIYGAAYILPIVDGGNNPDNNQADLSFGLNRSVEQLDAFANRNSAAYESIRFWIVYIGTAFQSLTNIDNDPLGENIAFGFTYCNSSTHVIATGGDASWIFVEAMYDGEQTCINPPIESFLELRSVPHEVGHQMGLDHYDALSNIMNSSINQKPTLYGFPNNYLNLLRCREDSPHLP